MNITRIGGYMEKSKINELENNVNLNNSYYKAYEKRINKYMKMAAYGHQIIQALMLLKQ